MTGNIRPMKKILVALVAAFLCVGLFAKGEYKYYYVFDKTVKTVSKYNDKNKVTFEKGSWFYEPFYIASPEAYGTIELDGCPVETGYHLITWEEYESITNGKQILKDQDRFRRFVRNVYPMQNYKAWNAGEDYNPRYFNITFNFWMLLLFLLPLFIPGAILIWIQSRCEEASSPSAVYAWAAVLVVGLEAAIVYFYGRFLLSADFAKVTVANFWGGALLALAFLCIVMPCMHIKSATKALYGVRFSGVNILAFLAIWGLAGTIGLPLLLVEANVYLHFIPDDEAIAKAVVIACSGIGLIFAMVYMWRVLRKQNREAGGLMIPLVLLAIISCGLLPFIILGFLLNAASKGGGSESAPAKELPRVCRNCFRFDGDGCRLGCDTRIEEPYDHRVIAPDSDTCGSFSPR